MKNIVLIDFTDESIHALDYAAHFTKAIKGNLEILNVSDDDKTAEASQRLQDLKNQYSTEDFPVKVNELIGDIQEEITEFINNEKVGFVFCGTHDIRFLERFFSSRMMHIMNHVKANFVFVPHNLKAYKPINQVLMPIFSAKHSLQNIEALRFLHHFMPFKVTLASNTAPLPDTKTNLMVASKLLKSAALPYDVETFGRTEDDLKKGLADMAKMTKSDAISIVNLTEQNLFNFGTKGFMEEIIRNKQGVPVLVIQDHHTGYLSGFITQGIH
ncbi:MAG: hypothetical protein GQ574_27240 [Crocinitomix sp.]|nr:hypothetical protein [Crocinitomix sp.]